MNGKVHMFLEGMIVALIVRLELKALQEIIWRNKYDKLMLDVKFKKALYGTQAALLFCNLLSDTLKEWGFNLCDKQKHK